MADKRIIEQNASTTVPDDAFFIFDSALLGTFKISRSALLDLFGESGTLALTKIANAIAQEYDPTQTYNRTSYVFHNGKLYNGDASNITSDWDGSKWSEANVITLAKQGIATGDLALAKIRNSIASDYDPNPGTTIVAGTYVFHNSRLYRALEEVSGAWDSSKFEEVNIPEYIDYVLENAGQVQDVTVDGTSVVTNKVAEIEIPVKDVQVKTDSTYDSVVDASGNAKIDLSSVTAYGEVPNLPQAIASFNDGADAPMKSLKVAIEPQQDLHGYDAPWVGGSGRNLFSVGSRVDGTIADVRYTSDDEYIYLNGTKQGIGYADLSSASNITLDSGTYYIRAFVISGTASNAVELYPYDGTNNLTGNIINNERMLTLSERKTFRFRFAIWTDGTVLTNYKVGIVISKTSSIDKFYPYSNICPISGWDEADLTVADDVDNPTVENVYTIDLDGTRYGGTLDVVSGVLTVKWIAVSLGNINYTKSQSGLFQTNEIANAVKKSSSSSTPTGFIKSSHFREIDSASITGPQGSNPSPDGVMALSSSGMLYFNYWAVTDIADFKTAMASATFIYELATPLTIQLTPTAVKSLRGSNNVWADTGDINDCIYQRDMNTTINDIIARLEALEG